jgi:hypothetical protein
MTSLEQAALAYSDDGFATLPVKSNKRPDIDAWTCFQKTKPSKSVIRGWFNGSKPRTTGLAIISGKVSGNIEVLDIDCKYDLTGSLMEDFCSLVKEHLPGLFPKLVIAKTVNKGFHILIRVPVEAIEGNQKLASRPATSGEAPEGDKLKTLIETKGEGGYFVAAPTVGYEWSQGTFKEIPLITAKERETLFTIAKSFDQTPVKKTTGEKTEQKPYAAVSGEVSPFCDYNARADVPALLEKHGWTHVYQRGESIHYKRPGTTDSITSANFHTGLRIFYVFSTSTEFEAARGFNPVQVFAQLEHGGVYSAASRALYAAGYGSRRSGKAETEKPDEFTDAPNQQNQASPLRPLKTVKMSEVTAEKVEWLWNPFVPLGMFTLIDGEEGIGKSLIALQGLGCAVATGRKIDTSGGVLSFINTDASNVLLMSAEESLSFVVRPRLLAVDAPCERFIAIDEAFTLDSDGIIRLSMAIAEHAPKLVIIDPMFSYTGKVRLNDDNEIRTITDPLTRLAEKFDCAIIGIRHINKSKGFGDARNAGLNGVGWRAAARSALLIGIDKETGETAVVQTKTNLSEKSKKGFGYKIESAQITLENGEIISAPKLYWTGASDLTAETMLSALRSETTEEKSEKQDAIAFLRDFLKKGEKTSVEVFSAAKKIGISERTLKRAKADLGVRSVKRGGTFGGEQGWFWELPDAEGCQENAEGCQRDKVGNLPSYRVNKSIYINNLAEGCHVAPFSQKNPKKPTEEAHVAPFSKTIENKGSYSDNTAEGGQGSLSGTLQSNNGHLQEDFYNCLYCGAAIELAAEVCPGCEKTQLPSF